jgi:anti-sigma-K factor RskA
MPRPLRYQNPELQDLLASNYVTGTLRGPARKRMKTLMREDAALQKRVRQWESKLQPLHQVTPEITPKKSTWANIAKAINGAADPLMEKILKRLRFYKYLSATAMTCALVIAVMAWAPMQQEKPAAINYVAVMKDNQEQPSMVVTLTKEGRVLALDMLEKPTLETNQNLQLWAISKQDGSVNSLGVIDVNKRIEKSLTKPQWGLIKDAEYLIVSVENLGGSVSGTPSGQVISKGLCVKVEGWKSETG